MPHQCSAIAKTCPKSGYFLFHSFFWNWISIPFFHYLSLIKRIVNVMRVWSAGFVLQQKILRIYVYSKKFRIFLDLKFPLELIQCFPDKCVFWSLTLMMSSINTKKVRKFCKFGTYDNCWHFSDNVWHFKQD